ncbi:MAG: dihydrolipoyl dehydrogenase [Betaproteobacteria bacterium]|nr:dihydrolipoyl dehydrogenase [Betaproteobacteria bacterium]
MIETAVENIIIGAGTAGLAAYRALVAAGKNVVLIESGPYGTTCARVGCMPSKLLIAAAEAIHGVARWQAFGIRLEGQIHVDGRAVMNRIKRERDRFVGFVLEGVAAIPSEHKMFGRANFVDEHTVEVDGKRRIHFEKAVIATGSSPVIPPMLQGLGERVIVNDDVFNWDDLPRSVAVFGPGVIGLELGQALHRLGVRVHLFGRGGAVGPLTDPALKDYAVRLFGKELTLDTGARLIHAQRYNDTVLLKWQDRGGVLQQTAVDVVIAATGRAPNISGLGLGRLGLAMHSNGVPVFNRETMQCGNSPIFIAGDANHDVPLLHEAADEGKIAGTNAAAFPNAAAGLRRAPLAIVFSDPQITTVGQRWEALDKQGIVVGEASFEDQGRSRIMLRNQGLLHVYADRVTGKFLGAEMIGPDAEHIGHLLAWALQLGTTIEDMLKLPFYHPVVEEGLRTALRSAAAQLEQPAILQSAA